MGGEEFTQICAGRQKRNFSAQEGERLPQILHAVNVDLIDHRGFQRIGFGNKQRALATSARFQCNRQHAFHGAHRTVQGELAYEAKILERRTVEFFRHGNHSKSDWQVESRSLLFYVRRGEIDRGATAWPIIAAVCDRSGDTVAAFLYRCVWQPNDHNVRVATRPVHFDLHFVSIYAVNGSGINFRQHRSTRVSEKETREKCQMPLEYGAA